MIVWILSIFLFTSDQANLAAVEANARPRPECEEVEIYQQDADCPERMRWALLTISNRESPGSWSPDRMWTGVSKMDSWASPNAKRKGYNRGILHWWCPFHWGSGTFATISSYGLFYTYNVKYVEAYGNCVPWWYMAMNSVAADVSAKRYIAMCSSTPVDLDVKTGDGWCPTLNQIMATRRRYYARERRARAQELRRKCIESRGWARCRRPGDPARPPRSG